MDSKKNGFKKVIEAVEAASAHELQALSGIQTAIESLQPDSFSPELSIKKTPRSVQKNNNKTIKNHEKSIPEGQFDVGTKINALDVNLSSLNSLNSNQKTTKNSANHDFSSNNQSKNNKKSTESADVKPKKLSGDGRAESVNAARKAYSARLTSNSGGLEKPAERQRDESGRFIKGSHSADAAEKQRAEHKNDDRQNSKDKDRAETETFLKKLSKAFDEFESPTETKAGDAIGYGIAGPLWAAGKEAFEVTKELGGSVNSARKSLLSFMNDKESGKDKRGGILSRGFGRKSKSSIDAIQLNTQRQAIQETQEQTDAIREGDKAIIERLDKIAGNTAGNKKSLLGSIASLFGGIGKKLLAMAGIRGAGRLAGGLLGRTAGKVVGGALGLKYLSNMFGKAGAGTVASGAAGGGEAAVAKGLFKRIGLKGLSKGLLRAIPIVGTVAGGAYDAVSGWGDKEGQRRAFGLSEGQDPSFQQKAAYTMGNVLDMGGLVSGISTALGQVLESLGFSDIGKALQFSTDDIAKAIDAGLTRAENAVVGLGTTITTTFDTYTSKIGEAVSGWFDTVEQKFEASMQGIKDFFTVDNLKKVFSDAFSELLEFVKHPFDSTKKAISDGVESAKSKASSVLDGVMEWGDKKYHQAKQAVVGDDKNPGIIPNAVNAAKETAGAAVKTAGDTVSKITSSPVVESARSAASAVSEKIGQDSMAVTNAGRAASVGDSDVQKAANAYNNGNADVKVNSLSPEGQQKLKEMDPYLAQLEAEYKLPAGLLHSVAAAESGGDASAVSPTGALGMFQMTSIARKDVGLDESDAFDPYLSAEAAAKLLSKYNKQAGGDWNDTITGYNAGMGTLQDWRAGKKDLSKENREYAIKVNAHRERYLGGQQFNESFGQKGAAPTAGNVAEKGRVFTDPASGVEYRAGDNPLDQGDLLSKIGKSLGVTDYAQQIMNAPGVRHQEVHGTFMSRGRSDGVPAADPIPERITPNNDSTSPLEQGGLLSRVGQRLGDTAYGKQILSAPGVRHQEVEGSFMSRGRSDGSDAFGTPVAGAAKTVSESEVGVVHEAPQSPTSRIQIDGRTIPDFGGSGIKPTMQLADNTVSLDGEMRAMFKRMNATLDKIEGHVSDTAKQSTSTSPKTETQQKGTDNSVPYFIDDPLMNEYAGAN